MVNRFIDTAVFYDAGKVAARTADLDFNGLKSDYGFGVRFHGPIGDAACASNWPGVTKAWRSSSRRPRYF